MLKTLKPETPVALVPSHALADSKPAKIPKALDKQRIRVGDLGPGQPAMTSEREGVFYMCTQSMPRRRKLNH